MRTFNWGIIGPGNIARDFVKDLELVEVPQRVSAVVGHNAESTEAFAEECNGCRSYTDFNSFLESETPDAVYIATPHPMHFEQTLSCLKKQIPVLCEKPMTINAEQSAQLIEAAREKNTFLMEGMWIRFLPSIDNLLEIIRSGTIGRIISISASMSYKAPKDPDSRYFDPALGGGSLLDLGIYPVFLTHLLLGKPDRVEASGTLSEKGIDKSCSMFFKYKSGQKAVLESSLLEQNEEPARIVGEKGTIRVLNPWFEKSKGLELQLWGEEPVVYPLEWPGHGLQFEIQEVLNCLQDKKIESAKLSHGFSLDIIQSLDEIRNQIHVTYDMYE